MQLMKTSPLNIALYASLAFGSLGLLACDKADSKSEETAPTVTAKVVPEATAVATAVAPEVAAAAGDEAACAGAKEGKHDGAECAKKSAEAGEGLGCNKWDEAAAKISKQEIPADATWKVLKVEGMTCGGCERRVIANVGAVDGVVAVEADSELGQVRVAIASGNTSAGKAASVKIGELGFTVQ
jgi:copper chaperone CopZ